MRNYWQRILVGFAMILLIGVGVAGLAKADDKTETKGTTEEGYVRLKSTTVDGVTTTKGTIGDKYVRTKTKDGVTKGTVDGEYIRIETKEVSKDFKPDWDPDW
jgi:hypothetical protein